MLFRFRLETKILWVKSTLQTCSPRVDTLASLKMFDVFSRFRNYLEHSSRCLVTIQTIYWYQLKIVWRYICFLKSIKLQYMNKNKITNYKLKCAIFLYLLYIGLFQLSFISLAIYEKYLMTMIIVQILESYSKKNCFIN